MEMQKKKDGESVSAQIKRLEKEAADLSLQQQTVSAQVSALRTRESQERGVNYAQEIFRLSQEKLRLSTEIDLRKAQANRLRLNNPEGLLQ